MTGSREPVALAIGVFDGVHRGHQTLLRDMVQQAESEGLRSVVVTFDPHPESVVHPETAHPALCTLDQRIDLLKGLGVDRVDVVTFTRKVSLETPEQFLQGLEASYDLRSLWVGADFALGHDRTGTVDELHRIGRALGFSVRVVEPICHGARPISSTWVRELLLAGDVRLAGTLVGRPYCLEGAVVVGARRGRQLGFPTANVRPPADRAIPSDGVYFVTARLSRGPEPPVAVSDRDGAGGAGLRGQESWFGVVNLGGRPTFGEAERLLETHLLDFEGDVYGARLEVCFLEQLRGVQRFSSVEDLRAQIQRDVAAARDLAGAQREMR